MFFSEKRLPRKFEPKPDYFTPVSETKTFAEEFQCEEKAFFSSKKKNRRMFCKTGFENEPQITINISAIETLTFLQKDVFRILVGESLSDNVVDKSTSAFK